MRIEMGRARKKHTTQDDTQRNPKVGVDDIKSTDRGEAGVVHQQRKVIESKKGSHKEEIALQENDARGDDLDYVVTATEKNEKRESQVGPGSERSSLNEEDYKMKENVLERPKSCSEGMDSISSNFQDLSRPESKSRNTYVKLWAHKESQRKDQSPNRIKVKIGSLSCGDTVRYLEAEKARVIGEIRAEHEKRLGSLGDTKKLMDKREQKSKEVEDSKEMELSVRDGAEAKGLQSDEEKSGKPMGLEAKGKGKTEEEHDRAEDGAAESNEKQSTERDETCSQELRFRPISYGKIIQQADKELRIAHENTVQKVKQNADKELRVADENTLQPDTKAKRGTGQENKLIRVVTDQVQAPREQAESKGPKRASTRPIFDTVKKKEQRTTQNSTENMGRTATFLFHPPSSVDPRSYRSCQGDKWATRFDKCPLGSAEVDNGRAAKQGEEEEEEKELQKRALFHLEALRRIEESYKRRRNREKYNSSRSKRPNEMPLHYRGCWDNNYYSGVHETQKHQLRNLQKKGKGGLNALLAPVFEEEIQRQFVNLDQNSPTNSSADKQVLIFQRMKKARLRAAEEQIAAARARSKQRSAQLKSTTPKTVEKARALEQEPDRKDKKIGGECLRAQTDRLSAKQAQERLHTSKPESNYKALEQPVKRIKELNEKGRTEEELKGERNKRAQIKDEERKVTLRKGAADSAPVALYSQLSKDDRRERSGLRSEINSRFKSPLIRSQKMSSYNGLQSPRFRPVEMNTRFRSPLASPRKAMNGNALEHFANWEKELRTAQRSKSQSKERSTERRVSIQEDPMQNTGTRKNPEQTTSSREKVLTTTNRLCNKEKMSKSPPRNQSPVNMLRHEAIPDHYNSVEEGSTCDIKYKKQMKEMKEMKERIEVKVMDGKSKQTAKGARRRENCHSMNWLGKLYYTITSFS